MTARRMREAAAEYFEAGAERLDIIAKGARSAVAPSLEAIAERERTTASRIRSLPLPSPTDEDVERVALAICDAAGLSYAAWGKAAARAAIAAYEEGGE